ncbi:MAG: DUF1450 domain-containing protein [Alicyclobacillus sp.]|nr:DUF1450 domain-containing protein [Alicyclobacillus sp.]
MAIYTHKLEVCVSNLDLGSQAVWDWVAEKYPNVRLRRWGCLGWCHRCIHGPAVLMDDDTYLEAPSAEELFARVESYLREHGEAPRPGAAS